MSLDAAVRQGFSQAVSEWQGLLLVRDQGPVSHGGKNVITSYPTKKC